jgi:hypothetical protein
VHGTGTVILDGAPVGGASNINYGGGVLANALGVTQATLDNLASFANMHVGTNSADVALIGNSLFTTLNLSVNGPITAKLPTEFSALGGIIFQVGAQLGSSGQALTFDNAVRINGTASVRTDGNNNAGAPITFLGTVDGEIAGSDTLGVGAGTSTVSFTSIGTSIPLARVQDFGGDTVSVSGAFNAATLDLSAKTDGSFNVAGRATVDAINTGPAPLPGLPGAPFSVSFTGGGLIDPVFQNGGTVNLAGTFGITDLTNGIIVPNATTQVSGSINTLNAPIDFARLVLTGNTILNAGPGGTISLGSVSQGIFDLTLIDASGTRFLPGFRPQQTTNQVGDALGSLFSSSGSSGALGAVLAGLGAPVIDTGGTKMADSSTQGGLVSTTSGFEAQTEDSSSGSAPQGGAPPTGGNAPPSKPAPQKEAAPVSPVAPLLGGLVGVFQSTVLKAPPGVPGIDQPYSSDGNFGRW